MPLYNYKKLLEKDPNFNRWYNNIRRGSPISADAKLRRIGYVCRVFKLTTQKMAKMTPQKAYETIDDVITKLEGEGKTGEYQKDYVKALKSWFAHNNIVVTQKFKISKRNNRSSKTAQEQSPVPEQLRLVLNACDQKQRVECALVAFSGLRLESLGDYLGEDGLELRDLPELEYDNNNKIVSFAKVPTLIIVRDTISKAGHQYVTFMAEEGCGYIKEFLELRMRMGETLTANSPLVSSLKYYKRLKDSHITTTKVSESIRTAIRDAGFDWRPYILRTYFDTRLLIAEAEAMIIRDYRVFWMGHVGDMEFRYTLNKGRLPEDLIEKMRSAYERAAEKHLVTIRKTDATTDKINEELNRTILTISGFTEDQIIKLGDLGSITKEQLAELLTNNHKAALGLNGNTQKIVPISELEEWINQGWDFVRDIPGDKVIIRLPKQ